MRGQFKGRVNLDELATRLISEMMSELKGEYPDIEVSQSSLSSWIIKNFYDKHFIMNKKRLADSFLLLRRFVQKRLKAAKTEEEMKHILREAAERYLDDLKKTSAQKRKKMEGATPNDAAPGGLKNEQES